MKSKYKVVVKDAIDRYWGEHHAPPTIRDIAIFALPVKINSTSLIREVMHDLPGMDFDNGRPVPRWVINAVEKAYDKKTKVSVSG